MAKTLLGATILLLVLYAADTLSTNSPEVTTDWAGAIKEAMDQRDSFLDSIRTIHKTWTMDNIMRSLPILKELPSKFKNFHEVDFTTVKKHNDPIALKFFRLIDAKYANIQVRDLFRHPSHEINYRETGLGFMLAKFKSTYDKECLYQLISPPNQRDIQMPLEKMCARIKKPSPDFASITKICVDFNTCVELSSSENENKIENACTSKKKCDIKKAVPKFAALLWYKISNYLARIICGKYKKNERKLEYKNIKKDLKHFISYMTVVGWDNFVKHGVSIGASSKLAKLKKLMKLVDKRKQLMRLEKRGCI